MPTITRYRIWCKTCQNFELHEEIFNSPEGGENQKKCLNCGTIYSSILLKDIPEEKIREQRKRYKEKKIKDFEKMFGLLTETADEKNIRELSHMFSPPGNDIEIRESDAGQKLIDEEKKRIREAQREEERRIRAEELEEISKYSHLGRNDICICGSGKKYKKCCLNRIESLK